MFYLIKHETRPVWFVGFDDNDAPLWGTRQAAERFPPNVRNLLAGKARGLGGRWVGPCDGTED